MNGNFGIRVSLQKPLSPAKKYAFEKWKAQEVCSIIRDNNEASIRVALRNGMHKKDSGVKHYKGIVMPHSRYVITRQEYADKNK